MSIQPKNGICIDCAEKGDLRKKPITGNRNDGYRCQYHYWNFRHSVNANSIKRNATVVRDAKLEDWFEMVGTFIKANPYCWECKTFIPPDLYRQASAHIIPKSIFPSVATHPLNFVVLAPITLGCGCHAQYDSSIDKACRMNVWQEAVKRFKLFEKYITETHKYLDLFKSKIYERPTTSPSLP